MDEDNQSLLEIVASLGVQVVAPYTLTLNKERIEFAAFFPHFGGRLGIVTDPDWSSLSPYTTSLMSAGVGYSCVSLEKPTKSSLMHMLRDWGWTGAPKHKPDWI